MSENLSVSLVIVSRNRPVELRRLLISLQYLQHENFEVIVVSNRDPAKENRDIPNISKLKFVQFDAANISKARNLGWAAAAGEIIAYCDDDAVPEPSWLGHLCAVFKDSDVGAAGGYVRGRNGISFQWQGRSFDHLGRHGTLALLSDQPQIFRGCKNQGIKTEGTNCAFRRKILQDIGGFDENFRYFMDETDVNYRLGCLGVKTAIVPLAQVHHGFAASATRSANRAPKDLFEIGASKAYFCHRHGHQDEVEAALTEFSQMQRQRLLGYMINGELEPFDIPKLMDSLHKGFKAGSKRRFQATQKLPLAHENKFRVFKAATSTPTTTALAGRPIYWLRMRAMARGLAQKGVNVTVFQLSFTSIFHRCGFHSDGYWLHSGGIYGKSDRNDQLFRLSTLKKRAKGEVARLKNIRPISQVQIIGENGAPMPENGNKSR